MRILAILAVAAGVVAAAAWGTASAAAPAAPSAGVPPAEMQEGLDSLQPTPVKDPGLTPVVFKPISTRALKALRPFLKNSPSLITDPRMADAAEVKTAAKRLFVAQLRDEAAGHDLLFVMGEGTAPACTPSARRLAGDGCDIEVIVDEGWITDWRTQKGIGSDPGILSFSTAGGPVLFLKASDGTSVLYCKGVDAWRWPFAYSQDPVRNSNGTYGPTRLDIRNPNGPMHC